MSKFIPPNNLLELSKIWEFRHAGNFLELLCPQKSDEWFYYRKFRITASNYEKLIGNSPYPKSSIQDGVNELLGLTPKLVPNTAMLLGIENEDRVRDYVKSKFDGMEITEPSLCISNRWISLPCLDKYGSPDRNPLHPFHFCNAGSPDGLISHKGQLANMEIKFTLNMYEKLLGEKPRSRFNNSRIPCIDKMFGNSGFIDKFGHITTSHYYQMQGCMHITNRPSCVYAVGSPDKVYIEDIPYDYNFYSNFLYPNLIHTAINDIIPQMTTDQVYEFKTQIEQLQKLIPNNEYICLEPFKVTSH